MNQTPGISTDWPLNQDYRDEILFGVETPFWCNKRNESCEKIGPFLDLPSHSQAVLPGVESGGQEHYACGGRCCTSFSKQMGIQNTARGNCLWVHQNARPCLQWEERITESSNSLWIICSSLTLSTMLIYKPHLSSFCFNTLHQKAQIS